MMLTTLPVTAFSQCSSRSRKREVRLILTMKEPRETEKWLMDIFFERKDMQRHKARRTTVKQETSSPRSHVICALIFMAQ